MLGIAGIGTQDVGVEGPDVQNAIIRRGNSPHAIPQALIPVTKENWEEGPGGLMSLGDMLKMA
eukprot:9172674-Karenia_brevis.AAC.1